MQANCGDPGYFFFVLNDRIYFAYGEPDSAINSEIRSVFDLDGNEIDDDPIAEALSDCMVAHVQVDSDALFFIQGGVADNLVYNNLYRLSLDDLSISEIYSSDLYNSNSFCLVEDYIILLRNSYQSGSDQLIRMAKNGDNQYIYTKRPASIEYGNFGMTAFQVTSDNVYLYEKGDTAYLEGTEDVYLEWISLEDLGVIFEGQISYN